MRESAFRNGWPNARWDIVKAPVSDSVKVRLVLAQGVEKTK